MPISGKAAMAERQAKALRLHVRGRTLDEIAAISQAEDWLPRPYAGRSGVHADIQRALKARREERQEWTDIYIERELAKLDEEERVAWVVLEALHYVVNQGEVVYVYPDQQPTFKKQGWARPRMDDETAAVIAAERDRLKKEPLVDVKPQLDALLVLLKIHERRAKLLGLDAPIKKQIDVGASDNVNERVSAALEQLAGLARSRQIGAATGDPATAVDPEIRHPG